jgi:serine/threonine protein kinase
MFYSLFSPSCSSCSSSGLILWEMITKEKPYIDLLDANNQIANHKKKGHHPQFPRRFPEDWATLISSCWEMDPEDRPDCDEIIDIIVNTIR